MNKSKLKDMKQPSVLWTEACIAAKKAVEDYVQNYGEPMYCGFANVKIKPARGKFVSLLKKCGVGMAGWNGGYSVSYYDIMDDHQYSFTQSMDLKEIACEAFAKHLIANGMSGITVESRAD